MGKISFDGGQTYIEGKQFEEADVNLLNKYVVTFQEHPSIIELVTAVTKHYTEIKKNYPNFSEKEYRFAAIKYAIDSLNKNIVFDKRFSTITVNCKLTNICPIVDENENDYVFNEDIDENICISVGRNSNE